jgi:predicted MPP superfamily phosphohydrolase
MKTKYILITILVLILYYIGSYYIGWKIFDAFLAGSTSIQALIYWNCFIAVSLAYILGRVGQVFFPSALSNALIVLGAYWLGVYFYLLLIWLAFDATLLIVRSLGIVFTDYDAYSMGSILLSVVAVITVYGAWNARKPRHQEYTITIHKPCRYDKLQIVMVSDIHLGVLIGKDRLEDLVSRIDALKPDIVLLPGDILDENIGNFLDQYMQTVLQRLKPPLGVFGCLGSHEYVWGSAERTIHALQLAGITILRDQYVKVADSFYLVGRDDYYRDKVTDYPRKSLSGILADCDKSLPIILLDHNPANWDEACLNGVDLQLSGHTHNGQLFPLNLITRSHFKLDYGYLKQGQYQLIVSSGYGTWLIPIRVGTKPEIISIRLHFDKNKV